MFNTVWTLWLSLSYAFYKHNSHFRMHSEVFCFRPPEGKSEEENEVKRMWTGNGVGRKMHVERQPDRAAGKEQGLVKNTCERHLAEGEIPQQGQDLV